MSVYVHCINGISLGSKKNPVPMLRDSVIMLDRLAKLVYILIYEGATWIHYHSVIC